MEIVGIVGSLRKESFNRKLFVIASRHAATFGVTLTEAPIKFLPTIDDDYDVVPWPAPAKQFFNQIRAADAALIISPEYNGAMPGVLKNAIDWASMGENAWINKPVAIMGVSKRPTGTAKMQVQLREALLNCGPVHSGPIHVVDSPQVAIGNAETAFRPDGSLADMKIDERVRELLQNLIDLVRKQN